MRYWTRLGLTILQQLIYISIKSDIKLENQGMLAGEALHGNLAGYRKLKHKKLGLRIVFHETVNAIEIIEVIAIGKRSDNEIYTISEKRIRNRWSYFNQPA